MTQLGITHGFAWAPSSRAPSLPQLPLRRGGGDGHLRSLPLRTAGEVVRCPE